jgi:hypothetical protein
VCTKAAGKLVHRRTSWRQKSGESPNDGVYASIAVAKANDGVFVRKATLPLFNALERADSTTIAAAKKLSTDDGCLQQVDVKVRSIFLRSAKQCLQVRRHSSS